MNNVARSQPSASDDDAHGGRFSVDRRRSPRWIDHTHQRIGDVDARKALNVLGFALNRTISFNRRVTWRSWCRKLLEMNDLAPQAGLEPATLRLTAAAVMINRR